jgi:hypothetical protein
MAETITTKGVSTLRWGTDGIAVIVTGTASPGYLQGVTVGQEYATKKVVKDELGFIVSRLYGDLTYKCSIKAIYKGCTPPATGDLLSVKTTYGAADHAIATYVCEKCSWTYANESELLLDIEATSSVGITS